MQSDPMEEWRRLTALYSEMGEIEIRDLAAQINDLTPTAQQIFRDELKKRGIAERPESPSPSNDSLPRESQWNLDDYHSNVDNADRESGAEEGNPPTEYSWKTPLIECGTREDAWQRSEMLRRAGIENWIEDPSTRSRVGAWTLRNPRIMVAADQLEQALAIAAQTIPQDIIDESRLPAEDFEVPRCPKCKAEDPTLESVEPSNNWLCESCGHTWSDPVPDSGV